MALAKFLKDLETDRNPITKQANGQDKSGLKVEGWLLRAIA